MQRSHPLVNVTPIPFWVPRPRMRYVSSVDVCQSCCCSESALMRLCSGNHGSMRLPLSLLPFLPFCCLSFLAADALNCGIFLRSDSVRSRWGSFPRRLAFTASLPGALSGPSLHAVSVIFFCQWQCCSLVSHRLLLWGKVYRRAALRPRY